MAVAVVQIVQDLGQLIRSKGHRPLIPGDDVGNGTLIGIQLPDQIGIIRPPHIHCRFTSAAVAGREVGAGQFSVVPQQFSRRLVHRLIADRRGIAAGAVSLAIVRLTAGGVAYIKVIAGVAVQIPHGIGPGRHCLGLQRLQRPRAAHLIGDDPLHIGLQGHHIHHREISAADALIAEAAVVFIVFEPSLDIRRTGDIGHHSQGKLLRLSIKLKQNLGGPGLGHCNAILCGPTDRDSVCVPSQTGQLCLKLSHGGLCLLGIGKGAPPHMIGSVDPRHKALAELGGCGLRAVKIAVAVRQLEVVAAHHSGISGGRGFRVSAGGGQIDVGAFEHADLLFRRTANLNKAAVFLEIAEAMAAPLSVRIVQVGRGQRPCSIVQPHPDDLTGVRSGSRRRRQPSQEQQRTQRGRDACDLSSHVIHHFRKRRHPIH